MKKIIVIIVAVFFTVGCAKWQRVDDAQKTIDIDMADCRVAANQLVLDRNDYVYESKTFSSSLGVIGSTGGMLSVGAGRSRGKAKPDKSSTSLYFKDCMYQKGWNIISKFNDLFQLQPDAEVKNGILVLVTAKVIVDGQTMFEGNGILYKIGARQLSADIEVRLMGKRAGDVIEFTKSAPQTMLGSSARNPKMLQVSTSGNNMQIKVELIGLYEER